LLLGVDEPWDEEDGCGSADQVVHDETISRWPPSRHREPSTLQRQSETVLWEAVRVNAADADISTGSGIGRRRGSGPGPRRAVVIENCTEVWMLPPIKEDILRACVSVSLTEGVELGKPVWELSRGGRAEHNAG
jgi:hypothetical protein